MATSTTTTTGSKVATHEQGMLSVRSDVSLDDGDVDALEREYASMADGVRGVFASGKTKDVAWRKAQLKQMRRAVKEMKDDIADAMYADLGRSRFEAIFLEAVGVIGEIDYILDNLDSWVKPEKVSTPLMLQPSSSEIQSVPLGVVLIVAPWNYPINLALMALAGVLCAGNCAVIKPSEVSSASARVIEKLVTKYLDTDAVKVVQGGVPETTALLRLRWDMIQYTGSGGVGRIVAKAAAEHLTPTSLELGGKSPAIIDDSCSLATTAKRLMNAKLMNNGQTCIAPDYVLVSERLAGPFVEACTAYVRKAYAGDPKASKDYGRIINERHWDRIMKLADPASHGGKLVGVKPLETADRANRYIPPTLVLNPAMDSPLMQEEIFGPVLPIVTVKDMSQAVAVVNAREHPLALYIFSESQAPIDFVLQNTTSGGTCVNDCLFHITNPGLPFGGVGTSGYGAYHGQQSFVEFSHRRSVMTRSTWIDPAVRYPPYDDAAADKILAFVASEGIPPAIKRALLVAGAGIVGLAAYAKL